MTIRTITAADKQRETRNASLNIMKRRLQEVENEINYLIMATPTGDRRNILCDAHIILLSLVGEVARLASEEFEEPKS